MKGRRITTLARFAALFLVAGVFACDGGTDPDPNRAPVAVGSIPPLTLTEGESTTVDVSQLFSDPDGDQLTYSATSSDNSVLTVSVSGSNVTATAVAEGTVDVTITATDPDGLSASQSISVMVQAANQTPVVTATIPAQTLTEGDTTTIDASGYFSDPDGDALTFSAQSSDTDAATASVDGSVVTIIAVAEGTATVTVTATDPQAASAMQEFTVTVEPGNRAPVAVGEIPAVELDEGTQFSATIDQFFSDPDGDTLTYTAAVSDTAVVTASISGTIITVITVAEGMATITITATDPEGLSATQDASITVLRVNQAPTLTDTIPHQDLMVGDTVTLDVSNNFTDPDGDTLTFTTETDDTAVATVSLDGSMVTVVGVGPGTAFITVTASDPDGASATQTFGASVAQGNRAPQAVGEIPVLLLPEGEGFTAPVDMFFTDPDGDTLTYAATVSDTAVATVSMTGSMITVTAVAEGMATITVTATDPEGLSATQTTTITVVSTNQAPMLTDTIQHQNMMPGDTLTFDLSNNFTDPDGDTLSFTAETDDTTVATVSIDGSMVTLVAVDVGTAFITVMATDPDGASATQTFAAFVAIGNRAPMAVGEIAAQTVAVGDSATVDVSGNFSDPDDDDLTYTAASSDDATVTVSVSGAMVTVTGVAAGSATVTVTATDPGDLSATQTFDVTVTTGNQSPMAVDSIAAQTVAVGDSATVEVSGNFSDPDDDDLTYTAASSDDATVTVSVSGAMVTVTGVAAGSATVTVTATDPGDLSATQAFDVTVSAGNQAPQVSDTVPVHDLLLVLDTADMSVVDTMTSVVLDMADYFSDPDGDELTYTATSSDDAIAMVESVEGSVVTTVAVSSDTSFAHDTTMLTVTATDPEGESVSQEVEVLVANSDYDLWDLIVIQDNGTIQLGGFIALGECFEVTNFPFSGTVYTVHWTTWQVKKGTGWVNLPGTYKAQEICPHLDLPDTPDGTYRVVGELTTYPFGGDPETESVLARRKSADYVKTSN